MKTMLRHPAVQVLGALLLSPLFTGCVSSKYAMVAHRGPTTPLELQGTKDPLKSTIDHVIVRNGAGAWKRETFWDEYQIVLTNHHPAPVTVLSLRLIDANGVALDPGENWGQLETEGRAWWSRRALSQNIALGAQAAAVGAGKIVAPVSVMLAVLALNGLPLAGPGIAAIAFPVLTEGINSRSVAKQREVTDEFEHRRLHLPATIPPGATLSCSAFYRISPGPQRMVLSYQLGSDLREVTIDLTALAGFHANQGMNLNPAPTPVSPVPIPHDPSTTSSTR